MVVLFINIVLEKKLPSIRKIKFFKKRRFKSDTYSGLPLQIKYYKHLLKNDSDNLFSS